MKEKILARFKAKYPAVNLSTKRLDALSARLESKITDESEIDAQLDAINEFTPFDELAKSDDTIISLKAKLKTVGKPAPQAGDEPQPPTADEMPAWAKALLGEVQSLKKDKAQSTIAEKLKSNDKLKDVPASFYKGRPLPENEEGIEAFVNDVVTDHAAFLQESGYGNIGEHKPPASTERVVPGKVKVDPALVAYAKKQNEKALASKK